MMELAGKTVIVTGGAGNIGLACALEIGRQGAKVVVTDLPQTDVDGVVATIRQEGGEAIAHKGDISQEADVAALMDSTEKAFGGIDALINVAARMREGPKERTLEILTGDYWDQVMGVNLRGAMLCCKYAMPSMLARGAGSIINFGSTAGILGDEGLLAYSTTKAGLLGFTRAVATTYGKQGIRCNAVSPGSVWKKEWQQGMGTKLDLMQRTRMTPRLGVPDDIAHMVVFLASDKASYITGQNFIVDGGGTAHQPWVGVK